MKKRNLLPTLVISTLLFVWILFSRVPVSAQPSGSIEAPKENFLAPTFILKSLDGDSVSLQEFRGQPVILNFWASWCPPCRAEMPDFQKAWEEYSGTDLVIIAINATNQDSRVDIENFVDQNQLDFPILLDINGSVSTLYQIHSLPTTFIIDQEGVIRNTLIGGPLPLSLLRTEADQLLQDDSDAPNN